jgi:hypothetical protein
MILKIKKLVNNKVLRISQVLLNGCRLVKDYIKKSRYSQNFYFCCAITDRFASGKDIKNSDMRNTFIFTVLAVMILSSFSKKQESMNNYKTPGKQEITLDSTKWWLTKIYTTDSFTEVSTKKAFVRFNKADGKISGNEVVTHLVAN